MAPLRHREQRDEWLPGSAGRGKLYEMRAACAIGARETRLPNDGNRPNGSLLRPADNASATATHFVLPVGREAPFAAAGLAAAPNPLRNRQVQRVCLAPRLPEVGSVARVSRRRHEAKGCLPVHDAVAVGVGAALGVILRVVRLRVSFCQVLWHRRFAADLRRVISLRSVLKLRRGLSLRLVLRGLRNVLDLRHVGGRIGCHGNEGAP